jgi:acetyltransferase
MSIRNLDRMFAPRSVAVIGASNRPRAVGGLALANMLAAGFKGTLMPVNPRESEIGGLRAWPDVASLPVAPDMAVIATPPDTVPGLIADLAKRGCAGAVVITAGFGEGGHEEGARRRQAMLDAARPALLRIVGPNCLGMLAPASGVNASFSPVPATAGSIACFTQSGAIAAALLDWASARGIGFRYLVSIGDTADVDFGDLLDYVAADPQTKSVLLYIESITSARKFLSAARSAARGKPVIVVKSGRHPAAAAAAASHTGALAGSDGVYDAAFRRAGVLRVPGLEQLFAAAETLARAHPMRGDRLAILTNGGGFGVLATDALLDAGGTLADLSPATRAALDKVLPQTWSHGDPIDIIGDAGGQRYADALGVLMADPDIDAVLTLNCPTGVASSQEAAEGVIRAWAARPAYHAPTLLGCWLGAHEAATARVQLAEAGIPAFESIESAIAGAMELAEFARNQKQLLHVPGRRDDTVTPPDRDLVDGLIIAARAAGRQWLDAGDVRSVLAAYGVPLVQSRSVATPAEAAAAADELGGPVVLKIRSSVITHKTDVGGVVLDLKGGASVRAAAESMLERVAVARPGVPIDGFVVERMARPADAFELIVGVTVDPTFGPVVLFGQGGIGVEAISDTALALPPLDLELARGLVARTRVWRLLKGFRTQPAVDLDGIARLLVAISQLALEHREIIELDINPFLASADGVIALDARIRLGDPAKAVPVAIVPYPHELETVAGLLDGAVVRLRPIRPEDAENLVDLHRSLAPEDIRTRFHGMLRELDATMLVRLTQIDYDREMAFIAFTEGDPVSLGVVRMHADPDNESAEFALLVRSDWHGRGLGTWLMQAIINYAKGRGTRRIVGSVLRDNIKMLTLIRGLGFHATAHDGDELTMVLELASPAV